MFKKIGQYYAKTFKKFGLIIPVLAIVVTFAVAIVLEATNAFTALLGAVESLFWILFAVGCAVVVAGVVLTVLNLKKTEVGVIDLCLTCISAITFLMIIMFLFTLGGGQMLLKWIVTSVVLVGSLLLTVFRSQKVN